MEPTRVLYLYSVNIPNPRITNGGGAIVGNSPVQLLFWGAFWDTAVNPSVYDIINAVQKIIDSPYLSELTQYGFQQLSFGGARTVYQPGPSFPTYSGDQVKSMIWDLIDNGRFPEPDEPNGRNVYMVFAPPGAVYEKLAAEGAHNAAWDVDGFSIDYAWVGWVNYGSLDAITTFLTHELVEIITDPEPAYLYPGWYFADQPEGNDEIGDVCSVNGINQTGIVEGYMAAAYYSERLKACVVPGNLMSRRVNLQQTAVTGRAVLLAEGEAELPESECFKGSYHWVLRGFTETITLTADVTSYTSPLITWKINDATAMSGALILPADYSADPLRALDPMPAGSSTLEMFIDGARIVISSAQQPPTWIKVSCEVKEAGLPDGYGLNRIANLNVNSSGLERVIDDPRYHDDLNKCIEKRIRIGKLALEKAGSVRDLVDPAPRWLNDVRLQLVPVEERSRLEQALLLANAIRPIDARLSQELVHLSIALVLFYAGRQRQ